jgi:hypothetical protein
VSPKQRVRPHAFEFRIRKGKGIPLWKDQQRMPRQEISVKVSHKLSKYSFSPVPPYSNPEPFSDDDAHLCDRSFPLTGQEVEEVGRNTAAVSLDPLDVPARSQEHALTP